MVQPEHFGWMNPRAVTVCQRAATTCEGRASAASRPRMATGMVYLMVKCHDDYHSNHRQSRACGPAEACTGFLADQSRRFFGTGKFRGSDHLAARARPGTHVQKARNVGIRFGTTPDGRRSNSDYTSGTRGTRPAQPGKIQQVKFFFDTSVLIAAVLVEHVHHEPSLAAYLKADKKNGCCAAHTLAEVYASLTRLPGPHRIGGDQALLFLEDIRRRLTTITL